jgi:hypothetical protein
MTISTMRGSVVAGVARPGQVCRIGHVASAIAAPSMTER